MKRRVVGVRPTSGLKRKLLESRKNTKLPQPSLRECGSDWLREPATNLTDIRWSLPFDRMARCGRDHQGAKFLDLQQVCRSHVSSAGCDRRRFPARYGAYRPPHLAAGYLEKLTNTRDQDGNGRRISGAVVVGSQGRTHIGPPPRRRRTR